MNEQEKKELQSKIGDDVFKELIPRINELAHKAKNEGLSEVEKLEQADLRKKYVAHFRENFKKQIEMMKVYDKNGKEVTPGKVREVQRHKGLRDD
ncbi:DUF896 domain-containing protein [Lentilactobacillus buchneri]|uniref:UPF0291 protein LBUCD034_1099 n=2 Tax=Lentilactobacillus buchneri TaxID=1581 RepID=J9W545_LENBU|nr:DUF896 domain-containing protein [Lentilactobacillus buchneri]MCC6100398.1 DUF896 domain-containing protein [Lactobacillus sp.]WCJ51663.1 DUF896 domain-containing protein [Lentilactobacillus sp. Egmn17]AEB73222.1 UPF0291 protein [Lentilactobacillus buchneri NRRL B-30929]AFS00140.1 hypothetical protein LBUCD034_1099 [Lentilactobacillus buchneri subsp. silagei CD034]KRK67852.1 hypothetical protein FC79_GL001174 [Lentilactobacillus buchneri DSM 20057]